MFSLVSERGLPLNYSLTIRSEFLDIKRFTICTVKFERVYRTRRPPTTANNASSVRPFRVECRVIRLSAIPTGSDVTSRENDLYGCGFAPHHGQKKALVDDSGNGVKTLHKGKNSISICRPWLRIVFTSVLCAPLLLLLSGQSAG